MANDAQVRDLQSLLRSSDEVCRSYVELLHLDAELQWLIVSQQGGEMALDALAASERTPQRLSPTGAPSLFHTTVGYFSSGWPVAYLIATVIVGIGLVIGAVTRVSRYEEVAGDVPPAAAGHGITPQLGAEVVGWITGMVDCKWAKGSVPRGSNRGLSLGRELRIESGLVEITYETGATVLLQGPVAYAVESTNGGFLSLGKLTGKVEARQAKGFVVRTPTATVTDLGTEFGVEVDAVGRADVHVFRGVVECRPTAKQGEKGIGTKSIRLTEDMAARFVPDGTIIEGQKADRRQFSQFNLPRHRPLSLIGFYPMDGNVADASGNVNHVALAKMQGVTFVAGKEKEAAHFDPAVDSFIDLPVDARPRVMPKLTWGAWVRPRTIGPANAEILSTDIRGYGRTLTIDRRIGKDEQPSGAFRFAAFLGEEDLGRGVFPSTGPLPKPGVWTFVAAVYDGSVPRASLYVEDTRRRGAGGLVEDRMIGGHFGPATNFIRVGRHAGGMSVEAFDGDIDNVFIFRGALGIQELELICKQGATAIIALGKGERLTEDNISGRAMEH
jgi:hypothetical protein